MINLITIGGNSAPEFYMDPQYLADFKALLRTITSGRNFLVSTKFRSDLFYCSKLSMDEEIMKLWSLYVKYNKYPFPENITFVHGDEASLINYFQSINRISGNWYKYKLYKSAFLDSASRDYENPVGKTISQCDRFLIENKKFTRMPLIDFDAKEPYRLSDNVFSLAMEMIRNSTN